HVFIFSHKVYTLQPSGLHYTIFFFFPSQPILLLINYNKVGQPTSTPHPLTYEGLAHLGGAAKPPCGGRITTST
ncbi:hypothetical protein, partial [[Clostridium] symbiosum]|uniref:hypothetical protein n=1 Tax=Clostridium symbiosum TaxID=1512 RepID=UPI001AA189A7